jgi:hypothetical protein
MDWYIEDFKKLAGYLSKESGVTIKIFTDQGEGFRGLLTIEAILPAGPQRAGRDVTAKLRLSAPMEQWEQMLQKMGFIEDRLTNCFYSDATQKVRIRVYPGTWTRVSDESEIIFENDLVLQGVRLGA